MGARGDLQVRVLLFEGIPEVIVVADGRRFELSADAAFPAGSGRGGTVWRSPGASRLLDVEAAGRTVRVRGAVEVAQAGEELRVVNEIELEAYLAGTLGREMYGSWSADALRAQAVASRTYALHQRMARADTPWHLSAGTRSQVYGGVDAESAPIEEALDATRGEVLVFGGRPILAAFHSSSGGQTASAEEVWGDDRAYLVSVPVEDEWDSPDSYWRAEVTRGTLGRAAERRGAEIGPVQAVEILERTASGRVAQVRLRGEQGEATLTGRELRSALGESKLKSTLFEIRPAEDGWVFVGSGNGHGVGMSQWGARAMARRGADYREILETFYPGAEIRRLAP